VNARRNGDLVLVAGLALLCALLCGLLGGAPAAVRVLPAVLLVLALPGYALTAALIPPAALRGAERLVFAIALSIGATILATLALHLLSIRLGSGAWATALALVTLAAGAAAAARGHGRPLPAWRLHGVRTLEILALTGALLLAGSAFALGLTPLPAPKDTQGSTALWVVPQGSDSVQIGVRSDQLHTETYTVDLLLGGRRVRTYAPLRLDPGARWTVRAATGGPPAPVVEAILRLASAPRAVYRHVILRNGRVATPAAAGGRAVTRTTATRCRPSHPLRGARGCYRVVVRGSRAFRFYSSGVKVPIG